METFLKEQQSPLTCLYPLEILDNPLNERIIPELELEPATNLLSLLGKICDPTAEVKEVWS